MIPSIRTTAVIARRDFVSTVMSRTFILFLIAPLFPLLFGLLFGTVGADAGGKQAEPTTVGVIGDPPFASAVATAAARLNQGLPSAPDVEFLNKRTSQDPRILLRENGRLVAVLRLEGQRATLFGREAALKSVEPYVRVLLAEAATDRTLAAAGLNVMPPPSLKRDVVEASQADVGRQRHTLAKVAQTLMFVLTLMLSGVLLSNFIEEKANKVIEVLAAAAPVPSIFTGKLFAMLGSSLVGVTVWGGSALAVTILLMPQAFALIPTPAVGWPAFVVLGFLYFTANYLLVGALLLGIGAQAASVRQVQTLSLPVTTAQLLLYGLASISIGRPDSPAAITAALFPYSSPLAMIARAATEQALWPHLLALGWQVLWVVITISVAARWFKRGVLKSGSSVSPWPWRKRALS